MQGRLLGDAARAGHPVRGLSRKLRRSSSHRLCDVEPSLLRPVATCNRLRPATERHPSHPAVTRRASPATTATEGSIGAEASCGGGALLVCSVLTPAPRDLPGATTTPTPTYAACRSRQRTRSSCRAGLALVQGLYSMPLDARDRSVVPRRTVREFGSRSCLVRLGRRARRAKPATATT